MEGAPKPKSRSEHERQQLHEITDRDMHFSNLHDQDEDQSGEKIDLATGKPYNNSSETGHEKLSELTEDELDKIEDDEDAATKWLRENDPDYGKSDKAA